MSSLFGPNTGSSPSSTGSSSPSSNPNQSSAGASNNTFFYSGNSDVSTGPDIAYQYQQQALKNFNKQLRMSLAITNAAGQTTTFNAHLDPNHLINNQTKRLVQLDTLQGIIVQDFGYQIETIELKGTTGNRYYKDIQTLDTIFNSQNQTIPTPCTLIIESRTYTVIWKDFTFDRMQTNTGGNIVNYTMAFIVLQRGTASTDSTTSSVIQQNQSNSGSNSSGINNVTQVLINGISLTQYVQSLPNVPRSQTQQAVQIIIDLNPGGDGPSLTPTDTINNQLVLVPTNWPVALGNQGVISGQNGPNSGGLTPGGYAGGSA